MPKYNTLSFAGLNVTNHCLGQFEICFKSWFIIACKSSIFDVDDAKDVSSANSLVILCKLSVISFTNDKNKSGPSTDPWGTPEEMFLRREYDWPIKHVVVYLLNNLKSI